MAYMKRAEAREQRQRATEQDHRVSMTFELRQHQWLCVFLDIKTGKQLGPARRYLDSEVLTGIARRGKALRSQEDAHALNYAISQGRGRLTLLLTEDQYRKLTA